MIIFFLDTYFVPVTCFLLFNVGDFSGRLAASFVQWVCMILLVYTTISHLLKFKLSSISLSFLLLLVSIF